eukprot:CAMPEP_0117765282 /NCGR_PEP_ID=MMETSP0947-20121206/20009_1 /TAXON_ID=44440 /ORGANISM="Chattonella subsalsa, Strain CCMP2191" /LENGTH=303 /DNA_ID=CAMNT_0005587887 /DNA_START=51 /DNA_END=962 /DNA_ORIENTATION=+
MNTSAVTPHHLEYFEDRVDFFQLFQFYPFLENFYFEFEKKFNPGPVAMKMKANPHIPIIISIAYLLFCYFGPKVMAKRDAFDLRTPLTLWNLFLSAFSFIGVIRVVPHMFFILKEYGFYEIVCQNPRAMYGCGAAGLWVQLFILSKIPELFDTYFIVVRKKPLIFLHWYHHVSVLLFCWNSYVTETGMGIFFVAMNYSVHAIMYLYYALVAMKIRLKILPPWIITTAQISQMFAGITICCLSVYFMQHNECEGIQVTNLAAGAVMYGTYLALFLEFAVKKYIFSGKKRKAKGNKEEDNKAKTD